MSGIPLKAAEPESDHSPLRSTGLAKASPGTVAEIYSAHFPFVWRSLRRLGVPEGCLDDAAHDVFLVVHRRLAEFEGRSTLQTWLFGIALRVARVHRRRQATPTGEQAEALVAPGSAAPDEEAATGEAIRRIYAAMDCLDEEKRAVFVLTELEQMTAPQIAEALSIGVNTVYSRLRLARAEFQSAVDRQVARNSWRHRWLY